MEGVNILTINAGSSSLKCSLIETSDGRCLASGDADWASDDNGCSLELHNCYCRFSWTK